MDMTLLSKRSCYVAFAQEMEIQEGKVICLGFTEQIYRGMLLSQTWFGSQHAPYLHREENHMLLLAWKMKWNLMRKKTDVIMHGYQTYRSKETLQGNAELTQN